MRAPLTALVRLFGLVGVVATASAIGLARLVPEDPPYRGPATAMLCGVNAMSLFGSRSDGLIGVDGDSGAVVRCAIGDNEGLDLAASSPWCDETGEVEVIGRWKRTSRQGWDGDRCLESGLAVARYPSGEVLHRMPTEISVSGAPAWRPGRSGQTIVPAWDGKLYLITLKRRTGETELTQPVAIAWGIPVPGNAEVSLSDPVWPADPRFRGKLLVSLRRRVREDGSRGLLRSQLWWLELDDSGRLIIAAGCITPDTDAMYRRCPVPVMLEDGRPGLAYLVLTRRPLNDLRRAPLVFDATTRGLRLEIDAERTLAVGCTEAGRISVSADGTLLTSFVGSTLESMKSVRITLGPTGRPGASVFALLDRPGRLRP